MTIALQILCILLLISGGYLARARGWLSSQGTAEFSRVLVSLVYPALIISSVTRLSARDLVTHWVMPVSGVGICFTGLALGLLLKRLGRAMPERTGRSFLFQCLMNNSLFLPLPLVAGLYGERGVALLVLTASAFDVVLWTLGVLILAGGATLGERLRALFGPAFVTLLISLLWIFIRDIGGVRFDGAAPVERGARQLGELFLFGARLLGQGTVPISILVAGSRMAELSPGAMTAGRVWVVAAVRLVIVPALILPVLSLLPLEPEARGVMAIVAVMPCALVSAVFSERYHGDSAFIAGTLLLTHLLAVATVPLFLAWAG